MLTPSSFTISLYVSVGLFCVGCVVSLAGIALSAWRRDLWLFKRRDTPLGPLYEIHTKLWVYVFACVIQASFIAIGLFALGGAAC